MKNLKLDFDRIKTDPVYFIEEVINLSEPKLKLSPYHKEWLGFAFKYRRMSLMAFRSSGKTELLFVCYPIFKAFTCPGWQGIVTSNSERQAVDILRRIKQRIESNPILKTSIPRTRGDTWSKTEIVLSNGSWIASKPYNPNLRGYHVDWIGMDEMGEYRDHEILKKVIIPMLRAKKGSLIGVGTPTSELDLLHSIEKDDFFRSFKTERYPAEGEKGNLFNVRYPDVEVRHEQNIIELWEEGELVDSYGSMDWSQEFLLIPLGTDDQMFPITIVQPCLDASRPLALRKESYVKYYMGLDFAISASSAADYTVVTVLEKHPDEDKLRLVFIERRKGMSYDAQKAMITRYCDIFQPAKIMCDDGNIGKIFLQDLKKMRYPVEGYHFGGAGVIMSQSKRELFMALRELFERGQIVINASQGDLNTKIKINYLLDELTKFGIYQDPRTRTVKFQGRGKHDDMVDSLALAAYAGRNFSKGCFVVGRSGTVRSPILARTT